MSSRVWRAYALLSAWCPNVLPLRHRLYRLSSDLEARQLTSTMFGIVIDDATLLLALAIVVAIILTAAQSSVLQPALHPLVLARQGVPARVRAFQHSPTYRNANTPAGSRLAVRPRAAAQTVASLVRLGARTSAVTGTIGSSTSASAPSSTQETQSSPQTGVSAALLATPRGAMDMLALAAQLSAGIYHLARLDAGASVALSAGRMTDLAAATLLLPAVGTEDLKRLRLLVLPPGPVPHCGPYGPAPIPVLSTTARDLHTGLLGTPMLALTRLVVVPDEDLEDAKAVPKAANITIVSLSELLRAAKGTAELAASVEAVASCSVTPAPGTDTTLLTKAQSVYTHYYLPHARSWARVTEANLTAAVTAHLGAFAPDGIPTQRDRIGVVSSSVAGLDAAQLSPLASASGLGLLLLGIYTGAGIQFGQDAFARNSAWADGPTMLYTTPYAARDVATACAQHSSATYLGKWASRAALYRLRHGALHPGVGLRSGSGTAGRLWDWAYFRSARSAVVPHMRCVRHATIVSTTGRAVGRNTLDALRAFLGASVVHAYLPAHGQVAGFENAEQVGKPLARPDMAAAAAKLGVPAGTAAVFTAPVSVSHVADLQAFETGPYGAAHVGPPSVAAELQLAESPQLRQLGWTIEPVDAKSVDAEQLHTRWPDDPAGQVLVRGSVTAFAFHAPPREIPDPTGMWMSTTGIGSFRPNGTLVIVANQDDQGTVVHQVVEDAPGLGETTAPGSHLAVPSSLKTQ